MMINFPAMSVANRFGKAAETYDEHADIQEGLGRHLLSLIDGTPISILEIGCGTGNQTLALSQQFPKSTIVANDISSEMLAKARKKVPASNVSFVSAALEALPRKDPYHLIVSNAALHWAENFDRSLQACHERLSEKGEILVSMFGPDTFYELQAAINEALSYTVTLPAAYFLDDQMIMSSVSRFFSSVTIDIYYVKKTHASLLSLLQNIKKLGVHGSYGKEGFIWTKPMIDKIERSYLAYYQSIIATSQLYVIRGKK